MDTPTNRTELQQKMANEIAAFQRLLGERISERKPGEFTLRELAEAFGIGEESVRVKMRSACNRGEASERRALVDGVKMRVYKITTP